MSSDTKFNIVFGFIALVIGFLILWALTPFTVVDAGERGVITRLGEVNRVVDPGLHLKWPFVEKAIKFETRTRIIEREASAASKDLQTVTTRVALNYNVLPDGVGQLYEDLGTGYVARIIDPAIQDAVKAATAKFNAEAVITDRPLVKEAIVTDLKERLLPRNIVVSEVNLTDFEFSATFNEAIEAKVTAEQRALEAENKLRQVEFEAQQKVETAKAEAEAIRIQAQAITQQGGKDYVQLQAINKWNGVLPAQFVPGSAIPFINL